MYLGSDIIAQQVYFKDLQAQDDELKSFLFEAGEGTDILTEARNAPDFSYPSLILFMPVVDVWDDQTGNIEAHQENSFACLFLPAEATAQARDVAMGEAQLAAFRIIRQLRQSARSGALQLKSPRSWKIRPMTHVGPDNAVGVMVDFEIITSANALVGSAS